MGKCLQSQERIMILGTHSVLAQPEVRVPLCQGRQLWHHPVPQQLGQGGAGEGEEQQPVTACPGEAASVCSSSSSGVGRSPSSAAQLPSPHSLHEALPHPPHNMGFQVLLRHPLDIIHFFLIAASFALQTLTPANSPGSPGDVRGYAHPGTAAVALDSACLGIVRG